MAPSSARAFNQQLAQTSIPADFSSLNSGSLDIHISVEACFI